MIDFADPIIVANKIATTNRTVFLTPQEISSLIKEGSRGISGIGAKGKKRYL